MENRHYVRGYYVVEVRRIDELGGWGLHYEFGGWRIDEPTEWDNFSNKKWTGNMLVYYDKEGNVLGTSEFEIFKDYEIAIQFSERTRWACRPAEKANCTLLYAINDVGLAGGCDGDTLLKLVAGSILLVRSPTKIHPKEDPGNLVFAVGEGNSVFTVGEGDAAIDESCPSTPKRPARKEEAQGKKPPADDHKG